MSFGNYIKEIRVNKGITGRELARRTGISQPYLSQLETGKNKKPSIEVIMKIAKGLGVDYSKLIEIAGYINELEELEEKTELLNKEKETLQNNLNVAELRVDLFKALKKQKQLINTIKKMSDLHIQLTSDNDFYYKDHLLTKEEKQKILTIIETILE